MGAANATMPGRHAGSGTPGQIPRDPLCLTLAHEGLVELRVADVAVAQYCCQDDIPDDAKAGGGRVAKVSNV